MPNSMPFGINLVVSATKNGMFMDIMQSSLEKHKEWNGKIEVVSKVKIDNRESLSLAYTPGVAQPCLEIQKNPELSYELTRRSNMVAVITDGTAVLGLGDIGPLAGMPVMEGKCALFKEFADVDAFPIRITSYNVCYTKLLRLYFFSTNWAMRYTYSGISYNFV